MDMLAGVLISVNGAVDGIAASIPEVPSVGIDFGALYAGAADALALDKLQALLEATYLSHAGLLLDGGFFLEYGYGLAAIACALILLSVMWYSFRAQIVSMVDMKLPTGITYSAQELARKLSMGGVSARDSVDEKESMKMKSSPAASMKAESKTAKAPASMKKSPAKSMRKSPARGKTPTPSKKSPAKSMKKA